jgi:hypothetical protein
MRAQKRNYCAEVAALACVEYVLARANALYYLPDGRDVHCHGALPVPLVARLPRGGNYLPIIYQGNDEFRKQVQPHRERHPCDNPWLREAPRPIRYMEDISSCSGRRLLLERI